MLRRTADAALSWEFSVSDINSDLVTQEVDDEIRREKLQNFWRDYGKYIIGGAVGIVLVVAGREIYNWRVTTVESANSVAFEEAGQQAEAADADSAAIWRGAVSDMGAGYGALAELRLAAAEAEQGNLDAALAAYDALAANSGADPMLRDLASLQGAMLMADKQGRLDDAKARLGTIATAASAWYFSAQEQMALIEMQQGNLDSALLIFNQLNADTNTPPSIRDRAANLRDIIEGQQGVTPTAPTQEAAAGTETEGDAQ